MPAAYPERFNGSIRMQRANDWNTINQLETQMERLAPIR